MSTAVVLDPEKFTFEQLVDKAAWRDGPWKEEPDRVEWRHAGFPCLIVRGPLGALCGYVGLPPGHPDHGKHYDDLNYDAHGGLTFAAECHGHICHVARPGEPEHVWWLGFDCAHGGDYYMMKMPETEDARLSGPFGFGPGPYAVYRDLAYVVCEVNRLAERVALETAPSR